MFALCFVFAMAVFASDDKDLTSKTAPKPRTVLPARTTLSVIKIVQIK